MKYNISIANEVINLYSAKQIAENKYDLVMSLNKMRYNLFKPEFDYSNQLKKYADIIKKDSVSYKYNSNKKLFTKITDSDEEEIYNLSTKMIDSVSCDQSDIPTAILIGGQPGSGKTEIVNKTIREFYKEDKTIVLLDLDIYRSLYKNYLSILINNSDLYSILTNNSIGRIAERLSNYVISKKCNFIFEGTMGKYPYTLELLKQSQAKYNIVVKVMAVCREESILGIFERYIKQKKATNIGRLTTIEDHDSRYSNLLNVVSAIERENIEIEVYQRLNNSVNMVYKTSMKNNKYNSAESAIIEAREDSYNDCIISFNKRVDDIVREFTILNEEKKYNNILKKLQQMKK